MNSNILKKGLVNNSNLVKVPTYKFNKQASQWEILDKITTGKISKEISFITYNVWFISHNWNNRLKN